MRAINMTRGLPQGTSVNHDPRILASGGARALLRQPPSPTSWNSGYRTCAAAQCSLTLAQLHIPWRIP